MKFQMMGLVALALGFALSGCNGDPLKNFVDQEVKLTVAKGSSAATGNLNFTATTYTTEYQQVCDHYECGGYEQVCTPGREVCSPGRQVCTPVQRCTGSGCTTDSVCHTEGGSCYTEPGSCYQEYVSRTCDSNCREEPYQASHDHTITSPVSVSISGIADVSKIQSLSLGVKTNSQFVAAFTDASQRPKDYGYLWNVLSADEKTVLVAAAPGYKLSVGQNFLTLPAGFKAGDAVQIQATFETDSSATAKNGVTAVGTSVDFPELRFDQ